jgi:hypothetical protein
MKLLPKLSLIATAGIPLLGLFNHPRDTALLIYPTFVVACLSRRRLEMAADTIPGPWRLRLVGTFGIAGSLTETFAWADNYFKAATEPALFHPQLIPDLFVGLGFYGGWAAAWALTTRWYRYSLAEAFIITGLQGIFFEQLGAVAGLITRTFPVNPLLAILMGLYVFAVHGSAAGLALAPVASHIDNPMKSRHPARWPVASLLMVLFAFLGTWLVSLIAAGLGGMPAKGSISERPWW